MATDVFDELEWRGLVYESTEGLRDVLAREKVTLYIGFDPTAASLHVGSLLPMMALARMQRFGHSPIAIVGGGTGMIGDPSGKTAERQLLTIEQIDANLAGIRAQLAKVLDFDAAGNPARIVNNADWLRPLNLPRLPARHRQALHRQLHARQGIGEAAHRAGRRDLVHRVQLPDAAVVRLPDAVRPLPVHAADGRQRPVGQHHGRLRSHPPAARPPRRTAS